MTDLYFLENYLDMTVAQIFTLILVSSFPFGVIRYTILQSLNALLSPNNRISASSFYHSLEKLEKHGLIEFLRDENDKISLIKTTNKTSETLNQFGYLSVMSGVNIAGIINHYSTEIIDSLNITSPVNSVLVISKDLTLDLHLYPFIEQYAKHIHSLASDIDFARYIAPYSEKIHQTKVFNKKFREPNDEFDVTFLPTYYPSDNFHGTTNEEFWQEVVRVTKPGGRIITFAFEEMEKRGNFMLDGLIDLFNSNPMIGFTNQKEIQKTMETARIQKIEIKNFNGIIVAQGRID